MNSPFCWRKLFTNASECSDVIFVRVRDEDMAKNDLVFLKKLEDGAGFPPGVEQGGFARDFVPNEIAVHRDALSSGGDAAEFAPDAEIFFGRFPAGGEFLEFCGI